MSVLTFAVRKILLLLVIASCRGSEAAAPNSVVASVPAPVPVPLPMPMPMPVPVPVPVPAPVPVPPSAIPTRVPKGFAAKLVGAMTLNYDISDRGVAYFGAFTLKVTGKGVRKGGFLNPAGKTQSQADPLQAFTVDDTWVGHWAALDGRPVIHLEGQNQMGWQKGRGNTGIELRLAARDFVCTKVAPPTAGGAAAPEHLRCDLATPDTKLPWQGEFPDYLRVPLIFGLKGSVRSSVLVYDQRVDLSVSAIPLR